MVLTAHDERRLGGDGLSGFRHAMVTAEDFAGQDQGLRTCPAVCQATFDERLIGSLALHG